MLLLLIIGKVGCTKCTELKERLTKEGKAFDYKVFELMSREDRKRVAYLVRNENNGHFPLVINYLGEVIKEELI